MLPRVKNHFAVVFGNKINWGTSIEIWAQEVPHNRQKLYFMSKKQVEWQIFNSNEVHVTRAGRPHAKSVWGSTRICGVILGSRSWSSRWIRLFWTSVRAAHWKIFFLYCKQNVLFHVCIVVLEQVLLRIWVELYDWDLWEKIVAQTQCSSVEWWLIKTRWPGLLMRLLWVVQMQRAKSCVEVLRSQVCRAINTSVRQRCFSVQSKCRDDGTLT